MYANKTMTNGIDVKQVEGNAPLPVARLVELYDGTIEELRKCATADPRHEVDTHSADLIETKLLDYEASLVEQAARVPLKTEDDFEGIMSLWSKLVGLEEGQEISPSDRIVMNIFRHISDYKLASN